MSASPSGPPSGRTPNGGQPIMRRSKAADPLVRPKDRQRRRPMLPKGSSSTTTNGIPGASNSSKSQTKLQDPTLSSQNGTAPTHTSDAIPVPEGPYHDYPLMTTKRALLEGLRHHVARFSAKKVVDPRDEAEFTRPVRLHRRDPRAPPSGAGRSNDSQLADIDSKDMLLDEKEREKLEILRQEKEAEREAKLAQIAPASNAPVQKKSNAFKRKTQQVFRHDRTAGEQAESRLRYEEALPWHLEDFDGKNTWVGNYESALSETYAIIIMRPDGTFRMVPVEKWYKFTPKNLFKTLTIEEAESRMTKKVKEPRWVMDTQRANQQRLQEQEARKAGNKLFLGKWERGTSGRTSAARASEFAETDDLDFEEDFADDEENPLFEGDVEETKQAEERIKRDNLAANVFDLKEEKEYDKAELEEKLEAELERKLGKGVKKALMKREKNYIYESDSDNPYGEESESEDSETERLKEEERKKEEEQKLNGEKSKSKEGDKPMSGASSKGTNTPSGRSKHSDPLKKPSSLKRPGSPNLSEASGNESARKKAKTVKPSSSQYGPTSPPLSGSASDGVKSQDGSQRRSSVIRLSVEGSKLNEISSVAPKPAKGHGLYAGSGSEGESDGTRKPKIKLRLGGSPIGGSPAGSRAGSPETGRASSTGGIGSRVGSPDGSIGSPKQGPPTADEIVASIPPEGTSIASLLSKFRGRVGDKKQEFIALVKANSKYGPDKLLRPK